MWNIESSGSKAIIHLNQTELLQRHQARLFTSLFYDFTILQPVDCSSGKSHFFTSIRRRQTPNRQLIECRSSMLPSTEPPHNYIVAFGNERERGKQSEWDVRKGLGRVSAVSISNDPVHAKTNLLEPGHDFLGGVFTNHSAMHGVEDIYIVVAQFVDNVGVPIGPELLEVSGNHLAV